MKDLLTLYKEPSLRWQGGRQEVVNCGLPKEATSVKFLGYDRSGKREDSKGVLRVEIQRNSEDRYGLSSIVYFIDKNEGREMSVSIPRSSLDSEIEHLERKLDGERLRESEWRGLKRDSEVPDYFRSVNPKVSDDERLLVLRHLRDQVVRSLERPDVFRERLETILGNYEFDGISYKIQRADKTEDWGKDDFRYWQRSVEYVLTAEAFGDRKVLAHRFENDKRVCVEGTFVGDVRKMDQYEPTKFTLEQKRSLMHLFRTLHPEIEEVAFIDQTRVRTD